MSRGSIKAYESIAFRALSLREQTLILRARSVKKNAQAPYSGYRVGAAVTSKRSHIVVGCNVERVTHTQTTHAEQAAIDALVAHEGPIKISAIAISCTPQSKSKQKVPAWPCGHCLQIIWENCDGDSSVRILTDIGDRTVAITTIGVLLPMPFSPRRFLT
ncbi:MAG TPA: cytidine deaminase [Candidatus Paceibacterota bacterium]